MSKPYLQLNAVGKKSLLAAVVCATLASCGSTSPDVSSPQAAQSQSQTMTRSQIDQMIDRHTRDFMLLEPNLATALNLSAAVGGDYARRLPDYSVEGMKTVQRTMKKAAAELGSIDLEQLSDKDRLHVSVNKVIDEYFAGSEDFTGGYIDTWGGHFPYIVNQIAGPLIDIPTVLQEQHGVASRSDADNYLVRLQAFALMVDQVLDKLKADDKAGIILPKNLFAKTLGYLHGFVAIAGNEHTLVSSFVKKLEQVDAIDGKMRQQYVNKAIKLVESQIYPAYRQVSSYMAQQQHRAPEGDGIWAQPGGDAFYRHEILNFADSTLSPAKIHQIGLDEVARITTEMDRILKANGKHQGTVGERVIALNDDPQFLYEDSDAGRAELLDYLREQVALIMVKAPELFATLPKQDVVIKRVPINRQESASGGAYTPPSLDGSRPGVYVINLFDMKSNPRFGLKTLTYHEAVPGHHFQVALNMEQTDLGIMRQNGQFNAYVEGWALYSELLAKEMGMYEGDPWGDLGRLQGELYRAARLVVDTGIHYKKWSREKTVKYFQVTTGTSTYDAKNEINRYMAWPGQALGYKIGMLKMVELRQYAQSKLGDKFDIKAFHDLVLLPGARPLSILQQDVERWVLAINN